jgi:branched-chain amino acid transport system ATP-binding protein
MAESGGNGASSGGPVISVRGMSTGYGGNPVVHDLSFDVKAGEVLCLLGPNGAGKTTTMRALAGARSSSPASAARRRSTSAPATASPT